MKKISPELKKENWDLVSPTTEEKDYWNSKLDYLLSLPQEDLKELEKNGTPLEGRLIRTNHLIKS